MSIEIGYTNEEITRLVFEYESQPHGSKKAWRQARGISQGKLRRWVRAVFDGQPNRGLIPREGVPGMKARERRHIAASAGDPYEKISQLEARVQELEAVNDVLGKAIGLLQENNATQEPETSPQEPGPARTPRS